MLSEANHTKWAEKYPGTGPVIIRSQSNVSDASTRADGAETAYFASFAYYILGKGATSGEAISYHCSDFDAVKNVLGASDGAESDFEVTEAGRQQIRTNLHIIDMTDLPQKGTSSQLRYEGILNDAL